MFDVTAKVETLWTLITIRTLVLVVCFVGGVSYDEIPGGRRYS
jgi:hypothetical protein